MKVSTALRRLYRYLKQSSYGKSGFDDEFLKLKSIPRYEEGTILLKGKELRYLDGPSCFFIHKEIFEQEIYKFVSSTPQPYIIDAGANIGLGIIYFKQLFPNAEILAFEPDENVFNVLEENVRNFQLRNVRLMKKALWDVEGKLPFLGEGADAGRLTTDAGIESSLVESVRLGPFLERRVDFLKIDIEGAELVVLKDCQALLTNVERLFVEYHSFVGQEQLIAELLNILRSSGFRLYINAPGLKSKSPFVKVEAYQGMDMQLNIYGFRV